MIGCVLVLYLFGIVVSRFLDCVEHAPLMRIDNGPVDRMIDQELVQTHCHQALLTDWQRERGSGHNSILGQLCPPLWHHLSDETIRPAS